MNASTTCIIIGDPVSGSLSPLMHNRGYQDLGLSDQWRYLACTVREAQLEAAVAGIRALGIRGTSVTMPHKERVIPFLDEIDDAARRIGAVNTIVNREGVLCGTNTDFLGIQAPLLEHTPVKGVRSVVLGTGGAARAALYALCSLGSSVTIAGRSSDKVRKLADEFSVNGCLLGEVGPRVLEAQIVVNATPIGMGEDLGKLPINEEYLASSHIIFDTVYQPRETLLLAAARAKGAATIEGIEMLLHQGFAQFELFTEHAAPRETMRAALLTRG